VENQVPNCPVGGES